jgi:hypothetical protein
MFMDAQLNGFSAPAEHILGHTSLAIKQCHRYITHRATSRWPFDQVN